MSRFWKPLVIVIPSAAIVLAVLYMTYRFIDPIPPRHFVIAAGMAGSGYDNFARQYTRILARDGVVTILIHETVAGQGDGRLKVEGVVRCAKSLGNEISDTAPYTEWLAIVGSIVVALLVCAVLFSTAS